jgi:DNA-binding transcriptional MerR regulator
LNETLLTLEDVLREAQGIGLDLSERTFRYYSVMGLLPKPIKRPGGSGDARVHYYGQDIMQRLQDIRSLQSQGYSLKQIKDYFRVAVHVPQPRAESAGEDEDGRTLPSDAQTLLRAFSSPQMAEASRNFLATATQNLTEETLRQAAMLYYEELLGIFLGEERAALALHDVFAHLTPLEIETMLRPLRTLRNREWARRTQRKSVPAAGVLREVAGQLLAHGVPSPEQQADMKRTYHEVEKMRRALGQGIHDAGALAERLQSWIDMALHLLLRACDQLQDVSIENTPADKLHRVVMAALADLDDAERTIADVLRLLDTYRRLLDREAKQGASA